MREYIIQSHNNKRYLQNRSRNDVYLQLRGLCTPQGTEVTGLHPTDSANLLIDRGFDEAQKMHQDAIRRDNAFGLSEANSQAVIERSDEVLAVEIANQAIDDSGITRARSIARRPGGDVTLDTAYNGGTRFILTLPK